MSLRFPYLTLPTKGPVWPLGGRMGRPKALIPVSLLGPSGTAVQNALLDTGADDTVFPERVAAAIGIDLTNAPIGQGAGVGGAPVTVRYARTTLRLTDGHEQRQWTAWVGFTATPLARPLLGFAGCLQFFDALFLGGREEVELTVNPFYPGT